MATILGEFIERARERARDRLNSDRADSDQEEYLDRLGVEEELEVVERAEEPV